MLLSGLAALGAQQIKLPASFDKLAAKAEGAVDVTLDSGLLRMAARFLSDKDADEAKAKKAISGLERVAVRSFQFAGEGEYDKADLAGLRSQLQGQAWSRIVGAKSKATGEDIDVYFKIDAKGLLSGVFMIVAEPRSLTVVELAGTLDPEHLADLGGQFHIPEVDIAFRDNGGAK